MNDGYTPTISGPYTTRGATDRKVQVGTSIVKEDLSRIKQRSGGGQEDVYLVEEDICFTVVD